MQKVPILPGLPPEPSLESAYTGNKTDGLTRVFQIYDRARKEWSAKVALHLGRMQDAILAIAGRDATPTYANRGWASLWKTGDVRLDGGGSETLRPNSARIVISPFWSLATRTVSAEAGTRADIAPGTDYVVSSVQVMVISDSTEPTVDVSTRGTLRVTLVPGHNPARGLSNQIRRILVCYSYFDGEAGEEGSDWSQIHYFAPQNEADPGDTITWADMAIQGVYAELV